MMHSTHLSNKLPTKNAEALWNKVLPCNGVYDDYVFKGGVIEGLSESIRHFMRSYWQSKKNATEYELVCHATLLTKL